MYGNDHLIVFWITQYVQCTYIWCAFDEILHHCLAWDILLLYVVDSVHVI